MKKRIIAALAYTLQIVSYISSLFLSLALSVFFLYIIYMHGISKGLYIAILVWSFFVLCIPGGSSGILLTIIRTLTKNKLIYADGPIWLCALGFNIYTYAVHRSTYVASISTHLLYRIISTPWPHWCIIATIMLSIVYHTFWAHTLSKRKPIVHYITSLALSIAGLMLLGLLSYREVIIIANIQGS